MTTRITRSHSLFFLIYSQYLTKSYQPQAFSGRQPHRGRAQDNHTQALQPRKSEGWRVTAYVHETPGKKKNRKRVPSSRERFRPTRLYSNRLVINRTWPGLLWQWCRRFLTELIRKLAPRITGTAEFVRPPFSKSFNFLFNKIAERACSPLRLAKNA